MRDEIGGICHFKLWYMFSDYLNPSSKVSNETFEGCPGCEISSPITVLDIGIREEIVCFGGVFVALLLNFGNVLARGRINYFHSVLRGFGIDVFDKFVEVFKPHSWVDILEIFAQSVHQIWGSKVESHRFEVLNQIVWFLVQIVILKSEIVLNRLINAPNVKAKSRRRTVMVIVYVSKQIVWRISVILQRAPDHLHLLFIKSDVFVLIVYSGKEERLYSHSTEERGRRRLMSERINMPCDGGDSPERLFKPSVTNGHLINHILIVRSGLIRHAPSTVDELNLFICNQLFHLGLLIISSLVPPSIQEGDFDDRKFIGWILT